MSDPHVHDWFSTGGYRPHLVCDHCGATKEQQPMPIPKGWGIITPQLETKPSR